MATRPRQSTSRRATTRPASRHHETTSSRTWGDETRYGISLTPAVLEDLSEEIADRVFKRMSKQPALVDRYGLSDVIPISVPTIERLQRDGRIPVVRIGRRVLYDVQAVLAALSETAAGSPFDACLEAMSDIGTPSDNLRTANEGDRNNAQ